MTALALATKLYSPKKLSIACGDRKPDGFTGIDLNPDSAADINWDLWQYPWPIRDKSVAEFEIGHFVEHIPHWRPWWPLDGWWMFWNEMYRICKPDAEGLIVHPYNRSDRAFWDPTHERFIHEGTWAYLDKNWRVREKIESPDYNCDWDIVSITALGLSDEQMTRSSEFQAFSAQHYWNPFPDLQVRLRRR